MRILFVKDKNHRGEWLRRTSQLDGEINFHITVKFWGIFTAWCVCTASWPTNETYTRSLPRNLVILTTLVWWLFGNCWVIVLLLVQKNWKKNKTKHDPGWDWPDTSMKKEELVQIRPERKKKFDLVELQS